MSGPRVLIVMGSDTDLEPMRPCIETLEAFEIDSDVAVASSHRAPHLVERLAREAEGRGIKVVVAAAGASAHLAGVFASYTILPVLAVPLDSPALEGIDALHSIVQMPGGTPVSCLGVGRHGVRNAAFQALQILALEDANLRNRLYAHRDELADRVVAQNKHVQERLGRDQ